MSLEARIEKLEALVRVLNARLSSMPGEVTTATNAAYLKLSGGTLTGNLNIADGKVLNVYDTTNVDYVQLSHNGTQAKLDANTAIMYVGGGAVGTLRRMEFRGDGTNNFDVYLLNNTNASSIRLAKFNAYGLFNTSAGYISIAPFTGETRFNTASVDNSIVIYDSDGTDYIKLTHDSTIGIITTNAGLLQLSPATGTVRILVSGVNGYYYAYNSNGAYSVNMGHNGQDGKLSVNGIGDWDIDSFAGIYNFGLNETTDSRLRVYDSGKTQYIQLTHDTTDGQVSTTTGDIYLNAAAYVKFGTYTALGAEVLAGYITIRDAGGTLRKIAVIA